MKGNKNGLGKSFCGVLTESDVVTILHRFAKGDRIAEIAASFGVHGHTVRRISKRITWPDVQVDPVVEKARALRAATKDTGKYGTRIKVGQEKAEEIRRQFNLGRPIAAIAQEFGISVNNVRSAVTTSWKPRPGADLASLIADPVEPPRIKPLEKGYRIRRPAQPRRPRVQKTGVRCDACGMEMLRNPCDILRSKRFYCSVDCRNTKASDRVIEAQAKPEIRARMSASQKARMANPANRARLAAANLGKKASLETRSKMSASHIARLAERRAAKLRSRATKATM
jgi:DNA-binding CsgD family transcriptional regulator